MASHERCHFTTLRIQVLLIRTSRLLFCPPNLESRRDSISGDWRPNKSHRDSAKLGVRDVLPTPMLASDNSTAIRLLAGKQLGKIPSKYNF